MPGAAWAAAEQANRRTGIQRVMPARVSALLLEVKRELDSKALIYNIFRSHFDASGRWREGSALARHRRIDRRSQPRRRAACENPGFNLKSLT